MSLLSKDPLYSTLLFNALQGFVVGNILMLLEVTTEDRANDIDNKDDDLRLLVLEMFLTVPGVHLDLLKYLMDQSSSLLSQANAIFSPKW